MYDAARDAIQLFVSAEAPDHTWRLGYVAYELKPFLAKLEHSVPDAVITPALPGTPGAMIGLEP